MAFLAAVFVVMTTGILSDTLFHAPAPEKPGFIIEAAEGSAGGGAAAPAKEEVSIAVLMQSADPARGETVFKRCAACHTSEKGGANKVGPHLWDVVNRPAASVDGFGYSAAMKAFGAEETNGIMNISTSSSPRQRDTLKARPWALLAIRKITNAPI